MKVRCNDCMSVFYEEYIVAHENGDDLICPCCGHVGRIMDVPEEEFPQYYNEEPIDNMTSAGPITTICYDDGCAKGIQVLLDNTIVAMLDVYEPEDGEKEGEARVLAYKKEYDEDEEEVPIACITINRQERKRKL